MKAQASTYTISSLLKFIYQSQDEIVKAFSESEKFEVRIEASERENLSFEVLYVRKDLDLCL